MKAIKTPLIIDAYEQAINMLVDCNGTRVVAIIDCHNLPIHLADSVKDAIANDLLSAVNHHDQLRDLLSRAGGYVDDVVLGKKIEAILKTLDDEK